MSDTHADLVIRISTSGLVSDTTCASAEKAADSQLIAELRRCLQPGVEIALALEGYVATTSILWISDLESDGSLRAGVRLLGVSALPSDDPAESATRWDEAPLRAVAALSDSLVVRHHW
jgi:hypothetical protein